MNAEQFGARVFKPTRDSLDGVAEAVRGCRSVREAWERLIARNHIPESWADDPERRFSRAASPGKKPWNALPGSLDEVIAFASDVAGVRRTEELAREVAQRLTRVEKLALMAAGGAKRWLTSAPHRVVWNFRPVDATLKTSNLITRPDLNALFEALGFDGDATSEAGRKRMVEYARVLKASGYTGWAAASEFEDSPVLEFFPDEDPALRSILLSLVESQDCDDYDWIGYLPASAFVARHSRRYKGSLAEACVALYEVGYLLDSVTTEAIHLWAPPRSGWEPMAPRRRR